MDKTQAITRLIESHLTDAREERETWRKKVAQGNMEARIEYLKASARVTELTQLLAEISEL